MVSVFIGERDFNTETHTEERWPVMLEAEIRILLLQAKECQRLLATTRNQEKARGFFPRAFKENYGPALISNFKSLEL